MSRTLSLLIGVLALLGSARASLAEPDEAESDVFELGEVIVTARRHAVNVATTVTEISAEQIRAAGAQTVAAALDRLPGVDVQVGGKQEFHVKLRGFDQSDVRVLIDGVPAHETYFRSLDLSMLPVDAISKITVTKGASSVLHGPNTMGGVVNIVTRRGTETPRTRLDVAFGDFGTRHVALGHGAAIGEFSYWLTYGYRESDGFRLSDDFDEDDEFLGKDSSFAEDGGRRKLSGYRNHSLNAKVGYEPDDDTAIFLSFDYHDNERGIPPENDRFWAFSDWEQWHVNLVAERRFTDVFRMKARAFYVDHEDALEDVSEGEDQTAKKWFETSEFDDYSVGGELQAELDLGDHGLVRMGLSFIRDHNEQNEYQDDECHGVVRGWNDAGWQPSQTYEADTWSLGIEDEIALAENFTAVFGLSYDHFSPRKASDQPTPGSADAINPQGGLVYRPTDTTTLHASVGRKTRFPHLKELYSEHSGGNPDLDPQVTIAYEIGVECRAVDSLTVSLACFYNDIRDLITLVDLDGEDVYRNIGKAVIQGFETSARWEATEALTFSANYTYLDTRDRDNRRELEGRPRHRLNARAAYRLPCGFDVSLQGSFTKRQFEYDRDENARRIPEFLILDARLSYRLPEEDTGATLGIRPEFFLTVTNLTDRDYEEGHPMPGRNFLVGFALEF